MLGRRGLVFALVAFGAEGEPASAQDWFTAEACRIDQAQIDPAAYPPELETRYQAALAEVANPNGRLWRIVAPGGKVSHLWGTFHTPDPLLLDLPEALDEIIAAARVVALEFDPVPGSRAEIRDAFQIESLWRPWSSDPDYRDDIAPDVREWIALRLAEMDWDPVNLPRMTDAGLFSLLLYDPCGDYLASVLPGQDFYIAQVAYLAGAEVTGLQKPEDLANQLMDPSRAANARALVALYGAYLGPDAADPGARSTAYALYLQGRLGELSLWSSDWLQRVYSAEDAL